MPQINNLDDVFSLFESRTNLEKGLPPGNPNRVYRLDRMEALCDAFGRPQDTYRTIHLAGSKGKGSTSGYIAALLHSTGRRVGFYSSPHLCDYRERFRIEGSEFPEEQALNTAKYLLAELPKIEGSLPGEGPATTFELLTLFAFLFFRDVGCDTVVMETGLGGRLDATNVISMPEAVIFTPIELEHTEILGNSLKEIAAEKAGIMKRGISAWSAAQPYPARRVFRRRAGESAVQLTELPARLKDIEEIPSDNPSELAFRWRLKWKSAVQDEIELAMGGRIQAENAALAILVVRNLEDGSRADLKSLAAVHLPGRFQVLNQQPLTVIDGAHTSASVAAVSKAFLQLTGQTGEPPLLLFGSVAEKDSDAMAKVLCGGRAPGFGEVIISTPGTFKLSNPAEVAESFRKTRADVSLILDPTEAWMEALSRSAGRRPILVTGSFFMAGEIARLT